VLREQRQNEHHVYREFSINSAKVRGKAPREDSGSAGEEIDLEWTLRHRQIAKETVTGSPIKHIVKLRS